MALALVAQAPDLSNPLSEVGLLLAGVSALIAAVTLAIRVLKRGNGTSHDGALRAELAEVRRNQNAITSSMDSMKSALDTQTQDFLRHRLELYQVLNDTKRHLERQDEHLGRQDNELVVIKQLLADAANTLDTLHRRYFKDRGSNG